MPEPRFLVLRLGSLGDIVHTFPAVAALRATFPAAEIVWLTHPRYKLLVESSSVASEIWTVDTRSLSSLREAISRVHHASWDASIDYQGLWKSAALPFLAAVKRRIGFSSQTIREFGVPLLYTDQVNASTAHIAEQNGELSVRAGARQLVAPISLRVLPEDQAAVRAELRALSIDRYVVLSPGGGWRSKCWPPDRFGLLCRKITSALGLRCVVNYGPGEHALATAVRANSGDANPLLYDAGLGQLMALLRGAVCVVGGDTGPLHLAVALGTPVVALFGPTDPARNGPYHGVPRSPAEGKPSQLTNRSGEDIVLRAPHTVTTHTRSDETHPSMLAIDVDAVFDAVCRRVGVLG
jgi:lipopolysaccharide heptosyltransferase I